MKISVIIPVYNAADYVRQAVESALDQPETGEVILVEDASPDNSLTVCRELAAQYPHVHLYRHSDEMNHGEAASRNLAIAKSTCEYIACLDADDFFLPGRFSVDKELFNAAPTIDGVYGGLGEYIENEAARSRWVEADRRLGKLTTMTVRVPPEQLYEVVVTGRHGYFHLNATTVKRTVFEKTGPFNERLQLHTDTDMLWKMAALARLVPGELDEPVAVRRIHEHNTISTPRPPSDVYRTWMLSMNEAWCWGQKNLTPAQRQILLKRFLKGYKYYFWKLPFPSRIVDIWRKLVQRYWSDNL
jgi:glycosyltransferase involved in cell wall biosynthesis